MSDLEAKKQEMELIEQRLNLLVAETSQLIAETVVKLNTADDVARVQELARYRAIENYGIGSYDDVLKIAQELFQVPVAMVVFMGSETAWFKSNEMELPQIGPRSTSMCNVSICQEAPVVVPDASLDSRFTANPNVTEGGIRFYCAAPLISPAGYALGTVCVIDRQPKDDPSAEAVKALQALARQVMKQIELTRILKELQAVLNGKLGELT